MIKTENIAPREQIDAALAEGKYAIAEVALRELWRDKSNAGTARYLIQSYERLRGHAPFSSCRLRILRSCTFEPVIPILRAAAFTHRLDLSVELGAVNAYTQELLDPGNPLYASPTDVVILAVHTRDAAPDLWLGGDQSGIDFAARAEETLNHFRELISSFRARSTAALVVHNLEAPSQASAGVLDCQTRDGQLTAIRRINDGLREIAERERGVYVLDYDALVARYGRDRWFDERMWLTAKLPFGAHGLNYLADEWLRFLCPLAGRVAKVLVTDLDNTLWGGVVGEDGVEGLKLNTEYPGAAFVNVQRALLNLRRRGILLAIASKNNRGDAMPIIESHPNMLLRPADFAAESINWEDKPGNLRKMAAQLGLGLDSFAFLDDNHVERSRMRAELPEVTVLELTADPLAYASIIADAPELQRLQLSQEDQERARLYAERKERIESEQNYATVEDFYHSLNQELEIGSLDPANLARVAQLTQKTNQCNATTRRYNEQEINRLAADPRCDVFWARSQDKFGDNGLIGVVITRTENRVCEIDTFLLSCRVISRGIETALLAFLMDRCAQRVAHTLRGTIIPTAKNEPVRTLYERHGFAQLTPNGDNSEWTMAVKPAAIVCPEWIKMRIHNEQPANEYVSR